MTKKKIRLAFIGLGYRGKYLYQLASQIDEFEIIALADPHLEPMDYSAEIKLYSEGTLAYRQMLQAHSLDLVVIATPWHLQIDIALDCIHSNCHLALEIKGGLALNEYKELMALSLEKNRQVYPLENTLFRQDVLAVQQMVKAGLFGDLIHLHGAYRHDLRAILSGDEQNTACPWRKEYYKQTNGDLYPTHSLAPLCLIAGKNAKDFQSLTSIASTSKGWQAFKTKEENNFQTGDIIITHLEDQTGCIFSLIHDTTLPRPKAIEYEIQGTKGIWQAEHNRVYLQGLSPSEAWEDMSNYLEKYKHVYWQKWGVEALSIDQHHEGMDYIMLQVLISDLLGDLVYPTNLKDLNLWCNITPLSALSIKEKSTIPISSN